jgi:hypothetical protein
MSPICKPVFAARTANKLLSLALAATIAYMSAPSKSASFAHGAVVLITLNSPREKFWGAVLEINPAGVSIRGIDLNSFDEITAMLRAGEHVMPATVFFPLNRMERMELDASSGSIPSLAERFHSKSGQLASTFLGVEPEEFA